MKTAFCSRATNGKRSSLSRRYTLRYTLWFLLIGLVAAPLGAAEYFVSNSGDDGNPGTEASRPWRTLAKVNGFPFVPGDTVRFQRGGLWRGQLEPRSGSEKGPVTYTAYGEGPKPLLLGSIEKNKRDDWQQAGPSLWRAGPFPCDVGNVVFNDGRERLRSQRLSRGSSRL